MSDLSSSLTDVRRAYRLIWGYQRRLMDMLQVFEDEFPTHEFYAWSPLSFARPTQLTTSPVHKWAWDALPFYKASFLYTVVGSDPNHHRGGEWLFEVTIDTDDVDFSTFKGEPDAAKFPDAEMTDSTVKLVAWKSTGNGTFNWYHDLWNRGEWPTTDDVAFTQPNYPVQSLSLTVRLDDLPDREAALALVARFKAATSRELGLAHT
ncbi:MAG: hypothetical protein BGO80_13820 [Devosia sp. 63-57]|nr:MAG: hypothetical protein ABS74_16040 [Pelagibacterium sp. SCN 63-126]OJX42546.1 MAG: hypothetical protein BGO80_13820 [Devosia sp. 63-57]